MYYAALDGTSGGDGSIGDPWDLQTALDHPASVLPGDTIAVRGGTYVGAYTSSLAGSLGSPITLRPYPGERVTIDAHDATCNTLALTVNGHDAWYWGLEVCNSLVAYYAYDTLDIGIQVAGPRCKIINCIVHDHQLEGIGLWEEAEGAEAYGNLCYYNGRDDWAAYGIYAQNIGSSGQKLIKDNLTLNNASWGIHLYGASGIIQNFLVEGNIVGNNGSIGVNYSGIFAGSDNATPGEETSNNIFRNNILYAAGGGSTMLGLYNWTDTGPMHDITVEDNYIAGTSLPLRLTGVTENITIRRNYFYCADGGVVVSYLQSDLSTWEWDYNTYRRGIDWGAFANLSASQDGNLAWWRSHTLAFGGKSFDTHSTLTEGAIPYKPTQNKIMVVPNEYEPGRIHIAVLNWEGLSSVSVDVSGLIDVGQSYEVRNAQNYYGPVVSSGTYGGGSLTLPCTGLSMATCIGHATPAYTGPEWNVFIVVPV